MQSDREHSPKRVNEDTVNVKSLNKPKQETVDRSKISTNDQIKKLEHGPHLSNDFLYQYELEENQRALANSNKTILIYDSSKFLLFDSKLNLIKEILWKEFDSHGILTINDLTYLSCANCYLILTRSYIYQLNIESFEIQLIKEFSKKDKSDEEKLDFKSITAHNEHIFISYGEASAVSKWTWKPVLQLVNRWTKAKVVEENDREILSIRTDGTHVAVLIQGEKTRLEVFDFNLSTRIIHHLDLSSSATMLTSLHNNQWLVVDSERHQIIFVNEENQIENIEAKQSSPVNVGRLSNENFIVKCQKPNKLQIFSL